MKQTSVNCAGGANRSANRPISPQRANRGIRGDRGEEGKNLKFVDVSDFFAF